MTFTEKRKKAAAICRRVLDKRNLPQPPEGKAVSPHLLHTATEVIESCYKNGALVDAVIAASKEDLTKYINQEILYQFCFVLNNRVKRIKAAMQDVLEREGEHG